MSPISDHSPTTPGWPALDVTDAASLRRAFAHYPAGIAALAAQVDGIDHVIIASSFAVGISLEPPLVQFAIQNTSQTWPLLRNARRIGVSVLSTEHSELCRQLASQDRSTRLTGVPLDRTHDGAILLADSSLSMHCSVYAEYPAGDHSIAVLRVESLFLDQEKEPLVFHGSRFRSLADINNGDR